MTLPRLSTQLSNAERSGLSGALLKIQSLDKHNAHRTQLPHYCGILENNSRYVLGHGFDSWELIEELRKIPK